MATNPVPIPINGDASGIIICNSHAAYYQRVTLTWGANEDKTTVVFSGSGEGASMTTPDGSTSYDLPPTRQGYSISALFEYSTSGSSGPFYQASVKDPIINSGGGTTVITVTSEDSNDQDNNDSYLIITYKNL